MFTVKFPGKEVQFDSAVTAYDAARAAELISRDVLACRINGVVSDLTTPIDSDAEVELLTLTTRTARTFSVTQLPMFSRQL